MDTVDYLDVAHEINEASPFVTDARMLELWSEDFFSAVARQIIFV